MLATDAAASAGLVVFVVFMIVVSIPGLWIGWRLGARIFPHARPRVDEGESMHHPGIPADLARRLTRGYLLLMVVLALAVGLAIATAGAPWWLLLVAGGLAIPIVAMCVVMRRLRSA